MKLFWIAASLIGTPRREDIDEAMRFVALFGDKGVKMFRRELQSFHHSADESGLTARMTQLYRDHYQEPTEADVRASVESLLLAPTGRHYFESLVANPENAQYPEVMESTLEESLSRALQEPTPSAAEARPLDKLASLRRDGSPWIQLSMGLNVGVDHDAWPFASIMFLRHLYRHAAYCSQSEEWLDLRARYGFRELDVTVEFRLSIADGDGAAPSYPRDELGIRRASASRLAAFIPRPVPEGDEMSDPAEAGDAESSNVMNEVRQLLSSLPGGST